MKIIRKKEKVKKDIFDAIPKGSLFTFADGPNETVHMRIKSIYDNNGDMIINAIFVEGDEAGQTHLVEPYCRVIRFEGAFIKDYKDE